MTVQEDYKQLLNWQKTKDDEHGNQLVERYMPLVDYVTHRIGLQLPPSVDPGEIRSLGLEGLYDALTKYKPSFETKFETYATWRIKGAILDGLRKLDWLPRGLRDEVKKIDQAYLTLQQQRQREVTDDEVAAYLEMTVPQVKRVVRNSSLALVSSLHQEQFQEAEIDSQSALHKAQVTIPEQEIVKQAVRDQLQEAIQQLPEKEKLVVSLAYQEELRFTEIAEILSVSVSRVSQIHSKAMSRLRLAVYDVLEY